MSHALFAIGWFVTASMATASTGFASAADAAPDAHADAGRECTSAEACGQLADGYKIGKGVPRDPERARELYEY
jgi:TPR repeat protein